MVKVTAVSKALIGPRDQIMRSGSRHFGHFVKVRMIPTFLIGPSMIHVCCDWFVRTPDDNRLCDWQHDPFRYQGQDERQTGVLKLMVIDTSLCTCYASRRFIGRLRWTGSRHYLPLTTIPLAVNRDITYLSDVNRVCVIKCNEKRDRNVFTATFEMETLTNEDADVASNTVVFDKLCQDMDKIHTYIY